MNHPLAIQIWKSECVAYFESIGVNPYDAEREIDAWIESFPECIENSPKEEAEEIISTWGE